MASRSSGGIGFCGLLCIALVVLKLAEVGQAAKWPWWAVLGPLWIPFAVVVAFGLLSVALGAVGDAMRRRKWRKAR